MSLFPALAAAAIPLLVAAPCPEPLQVSSWFEEIQRSDGSWPSDAAVLHPGAQGTVIPGRGADSLAITAAMTLAMLADGSSATRGAHKDRVLSATRYLMDAINERAEPNGLLPGEPLALFALAECAYLESKGDPPTSVFSRVLLHAVGASLDRSLGRQGSGSHVPLDELELENIGWLGLASSVCIDCGAARFEPAFIAYVNRLRAHSDKSHTAAVFSLALQVRDARSRGLEDGSRFHAEFVRTARLLAESTPRNPALEAVLASAAYRIGGETWKSHSRRRLRSVARRSAMTVLPRDEGPSGGSTPIAFWPWSGDPRGTLWDTAWNVVSLTIYYRYSRLALTR